MNLGQIRLRVLQSCGLADSGDTYKDDVTYAIERTQDEILSMINFACLTTHDKTSIALTANTQTFDLPTDFWKMLIMWSDDTYDRELVRITPQEYKVYLSDIDTDTETTPHYYDLLGSSGTVKQIDFFDFKASVDTGDITAFADYTGTVANSVLVTSADHGLTTGNTVTITDTTNFDGTYLITYVSSSTFYIIVAVAATETGTWTREHYVPFVYMKKLAYPALDADENVLMEYYPHLYVEGSSYFMYRDRIYRDQPEKIAFRRQEFDRQIEYVRKAERSPDKIERVLPKRILPSMPSKLRTQTSGYSS